MADLKGIFESTREGIINERDAKIAAGKERERQWLKRTQEHKSILRRFSLRVVQLCHPHGETQAQAK